MFESGICTCVVIGGGDGGDAMRGDGRLSGDGSPRGDDGSTSGDCASMEDDDSISGDCASMGDLGGADGDCDSNLSSEKGSNLVIFNFLSISFNCSLIKKSIKDSKLSAYCPINNTNIILSKSLISCLKNFKHVVKKSFFVIK